jgi:hypothetical protein
LHSVVSDDLIQAILRGIASPASSDLGHMPGFKDSLSAIRSWSRCPICDSSSHPARRLGRCRCGRQPRHASDIALTASARRHYGLDEINPG